MAMQYVQHVSELALDCGARICYGSGGKAFLGFVGAIVGVPGGSEARGLMSTRWSITTTPEHCKQICVVCFTYRCSKRLI